MGGCGQREASASGTSHEYTTCRDDDCPRFICRVYKEGFSNGWDIGWDRGFAEGYAKGYEDGYRQGYEDGYKQGFPDGIAACPLPHGG